MDLTHIVQKTANAGEIQPSSAVLEKEKVGWKPPKEVQKGLDSAKASVEVRIYPTLQSTNLFEIKMSSDEYEKFINKICLQTNKTLESFQGGLIKRFLNQWKQLTSDDEILKIVTGVTLEFSEQPLQTITPYQRHFNVSETVAIESEIQNLLQKAVIAESFVSFDQFISPIFVREKKNGSYRLICNLQDLNQYITNHHFKMESLQRAIQMITKNCYMASIDLKDAYYCVPIAFEYQKYLKFMWNSKLYCYLACPMGLCVSPRIFTKLLKPVFATLRRQGHQSVIYIDDMYLQGHSIESCHDNVKATAELLMRLGFVINIDKSSLRATQRLEFLGFILDSVQMTVTLASHKIEKIEKLCIGVLKNHRLSIRECCKLIGTLVASFPAVPHGKLFYRQLENDKIMALKRAKGNFEAFMNISDLSIQDINWWLRNIRSASSPISRGQPELIIETDSSTKGWGCHCKALNLSAGGPWKANEADHHINVLELQAALFALKSICSRMSNIHIRLLMDSMTAVSYVREQGGSKSLKCNEIARQIWLWAYERNIWLSSAFIKGTNNKVADFESRNFKREYEWMLSSIVFSQLTSILQFAPEIDLFASRLNSQLPKYVSWRPEPESFAIDAFSMNWGDIKFYCFPPFSVIPAVLQKVKEDKATGILIIPEWPTQTFYSTIMRMLIRMPVYIKRRKDLLQMPGTTEVHKIWKNLNLLGCLISGNMSKIDSFQQTLQTSLWHHGEAERRNNTIPISNNGKYSVIDGKQIPFILL